MIIQCKINGIAYKLDVLMSKDEKQEGLKKYNYLPDHRGVIFVYYKDNISNYDFSKIGYKCRILFLNSNYEVIYHEKTKPYQDKLVSCNVPCRYVIEIGSPG